VRQLRARKELGLRRCRPVNLRDEFSRGIPEVVEVGGGGGFEGGFGVVGGGCGGGGVGVGGGGRWGGAGGGGGGGWGGGLRLCGGGGGGGNRERIQVRGTDSEKKTKKMG